MMLLGRLSFWFSLAGVGLVLMVVRATTSTRPMPDLPRPAIEKPAVDSISATGLVESSEENVRIGVPVGGLVQTVHVRVWDAVQAGDPLVTIDERAARAALASRRAELAVAEGERSKAHRLSSRSAALRQRQAISLEESERRDDELSITELRVLAATAAVAEAESAVERLTVRAPRSGTVLQVDARAGERVEPTSTRAVLVLGSTKALQVRAEVDEQLAPRVTPGMAAYGYVKGTSRSPIALEFVRIEPYVVPKQSLTGSSTERVDTRVLQVVYRLPEHLPSPVYVGQQMDVYLTQEPVR